ncbi:hypothetical protein I302_103956 [Kwoniella bestiolae CBS 10118]|uniref:BTB domain-containing protein n=1 Tax=Kwoniella bestiolae CBS 10118 TaxID=1296100 RepID=A0A1B9G9X6_9TREE|nr:hypothetical protein I302_02662 [Kwoniella bestiolae CBS 10118]OCF27813.1 hypothetical protein I302_02662 [Kwoniella bestiolae CBS 10118]
MSRSQPHPSSRKPSAASSSLKDRFTRMPNFPKASSISTSAVSGYSKLATEKWHAYHSHGDITLRSEDGKLFGADSWRLAKSSTVFHDMLEIAGPGTSSSSKKSGKRVPDPPIDMEVSSFVLELFLNLINVSIPLIPAFLPFRQIRELAELCEKFNINSSVQDHISQALQLAGVLEPWDLLLYACTKQRVELARRALEFMGPHGFIKVYPDVCGPEEPPSLRSIPFWSRFCLLSPSWQQELLLKVFQEPEYAVPEDPASAFDGFAKMVFKPWDQVVKDFNPRKQTLIRRLNIGTLIFEGTSTQGVTLERFRSDMDGVADTVFSDMLQIPQPLGNASVSTSKKRKRVDEVSPIDMKVSPIVLEAFLNLVNVSIPIPPYHLAFNEVQHLHSLCETFDIQYNIRHRVNRLLESAGKQDPWDLLAYASSRGDVSLARKALAFMGPDGFVGAGPSISIMGTHTLTKPKPNESLRSKSFSYRLNLLPDSWRRELVSLVFETPSFTADHSMQTRSKHKTTRTSKNKRTLGASTIPQRPFKRMETGTILRSERKGWSGTFEVKINWNTVVEDFNPQTW